MIERIFFEAKLHSELISVFFCSKLLQHFQTCVIAVYLFNVCVLMYNVYREFESKQEILWTYWWDILLSFHECFGESATWIGF